MRYDTVADAFIDRQRVITSYSIHYTKLYDALFVLLAGGTLRSGFPPFGIALWVMLAVTVVLAIVDMSRPSYHGIFWQRLNPGLPQWWEANRKGPA